MLIYLAILLSYTYLCISLGYLYRDIIVKRYISTAMEQAIGNSFLLSGDTVNYIRCLSILDQNDIESISNNLPIGYASIPIMFRIIPYTIHHTKMMIYRCISLCIKSKQD